MKYRTRGFTLIELIVVILILGILAAIAAPRFVNLTTTARAAALNGLRAAVSSAATLANALQTAQGLTPGQSVTIDGTAVTMVNGYPTANAGGIVAAVRFDNTFTGTDGQNFFVTAANNTAQCLFTYAAATATQPANVSTIVNANGC